MSRVGCRLRLAGGSDEVGQQGGRGGWVGWLPVHAAQRLLATHAHTLAEGAGAAALAAVLARPDLFADQRIAVVCTGGNASTAEIAALNG